MIGRVRLLLAAIAFLKRHALLGVGRTLRSYKTLIPVAVEYGPRALERAAPALAVVARDGALAGLPDGLGEHGPRVHDARAAPVRRVRHAAAHGGGEASVSRRPSLREHLGPDTGGGALCYHSADCELLYLSQSQR